MAIVNSVEEKCPTVNPNSFSSADHFSDAADGFFLSFCHSYRESALCFCFLFLLLPFFLSFPTGNLLLASHSDPPWDIIFWQSRQNVFTICQVEIAFDPAKDERNIRERGLSFTLAAEFDFESAATHVEQRRGEQRIVSVGYLGDRLHVLCYLETPFGIRVISFRKANLREARKYGIPKTLDR